MNEEYRKSLKKELVSVYDKRLELDEEKLSFNIFRNPNMFFNYIGNPKLFLERRNLKSKIYAESASLESVYSSLRDRYRSSFSHIDNRELIKKQENLDSRISDLEKRYERVKSLRSEGPFSGFSSRNRRAKSLLRKIKHEKTKREDLFNETMNEISKRGICLEVYYTQNLFGKN